jgi:hypothetical protein
MISTSDERGNGRGQEAPSFHPSAILRDLVEGWQVPDESEAAADPEPLPPRDEPNGPRFSLAELVDQEALSYREWNNSAGDFLARHMEELAQLVRWTQATTPDEYEARKEIWDAEIREQWEAIGYEEGKRHCQCGRCPGE